MQMFATLSLLFAVFLLPNTFIVVVNFDAVCPTYAFKFTLTLLPNSCISCIIFQFNFSLILDRQF